MQFLLLLSALLSALTGVIGGSRPGEGGAGTAEAHAQISPATAAVPRQAVASVRPLEAPVPVMRAAIGTPILAAEPARSAPLEFVRLNE